MFQYDVHDRKHLLKVQKLIKRKWNIMLSVCEVSTNQCFIHPSVSVLMLSRRHTWMRIYITCVTDRLHTRTKPDPQRTLFWSRASQEEITHRCVMVSFQTIQKSWKYNSVMKVIRSHHSDAVIPSTLNCLVKTRDFTNTLWDDSVVNITLSSTHDCTC